MRNKRISWLIALVFALGARLTPLSARDFGVRGLPIHQNTWTTSVLYEHLKTSDDFDTRGRADFAGHITGAEVSYGITDQWAVVVKGGVLIDPEEKAQGSIWQSRAGYLYGADLFNEVFPSTPGWRPGLQISGGVTGYQIPFDRQYSGGTVALIDQKLSGIEYHGDIIAKFKVAMAEPYAGVRAFGNSTTWRDNAAAPGSPDSITGHSKGNISLIVGVPVQLTKVLRLQLEGMFINQTALTAGFTVATF